VGLVAAGIALLISAGASAEPRFALREGMQCRHCHINRTGGGMRTAFGASFAQTNLATFRQRGAFDRNAGSSLALGANLRLSNRTLLAARTHLEGVERRTKKRNTFEMTEANLYVLARAIPDRLAVYVDETIGPESASNREAFVLVEGLPLDGYAKAGRFMLPFGLRIPDDNAFIRGETGFNYANSDLGVELGIAPHPFEVSLAVTNGSLGGSDTNVRKQVSLNAVLTGSHARAGLSFAWNDTSADGFSFQSITSGAHIAGRLGRLILLGELDWIHGITEPESYDQIALFTEATFEAYKGVFPRVRFEAFDPLRSLDNNERDRFVFAVSWFPIQLLELRAEYRLNRDIPQRVEGNADELIVQLHGFL
jgi:hypothetical protein